MKHPLTVLLVLATMAVAQKEMHTDTAKKVRPLHGMEQQSQLTDSANQSESKAQEKRPQCASSAQGGQATPQPAGVS